MSCLPGCSRKITGCSNFSHVGKWRCKQTSEGMSRLKQDVVYVNVEHGPNIRAIRLYKSETCMCTLGCRLITCALCVLRGLDWFHPQVSQSRRFIEDPGVQDIITFPSIHLVHSWWSHSDQVIILPLGDDHTSGPPVGHKRHRVIETPKHLQL